jgi:hypothetical protein
MREKQAPASKIPATASLGMTATLGHPDVVPKHSEQCQKDQIGSRCRGLKEVAVSALALQNSRGVLPEIGLISLEQRRDVPERKQVEVQIERGPLRSNGRSRLLLGRPTFSCLICRRYGLEAIEDDWCDSVPERRHGNVRTWER